MGGRGAEGRHMGPRAEGRGPRKTNTLDSKQIQKVIVLILRFQKENITFNENTSRYEVGLCFKEYHEILSDNYFNCKKRLNSLSKRFERNNELLQQYNNIIKEQLELNVVEKVPPSEASNFDQVGQTHYLSLRSVIKDDRVTSKVRIVFDGCSKIEGPSLNNCLYLGSWLIEPSLSVVLRFRGNKIVFTADIEKAFLQISLKPEHRDFVRFLWYDNENEITSENI